jgi:hypothetical protein
MRRRTFTLVPRVDADGLAASQTPAGAGAVTLDGALISGGVWTGNGCGQLVAIASGSDISNRTFVVTGKDVDGKSVTETITGPNNTTVNGSTYFSYISGITISGAAAGAITIGFAGEASSPTFTVNYKYKNFKASVGGVVTGTITYTVQHTLDQVFASDWYASSGKWLDHDDTNLVGASTDKDGNYAYPPAAVRCKIPTVTDGGTVKFTVIVPG